MARASARTELGLGAAVLVAVVLGSARTAAAHAIGVSRGDYSLEDGERQDGGRRGGEPRSSAGRDLVAELALRSADVATAVPGLDADGDGRVSDDELRRGQAALNAAFFDTLAVFADRVRCQAVPEQAALDANDGLRLRAVYRCPQAPARLRIVLGFLDRMTTGHRHLATVHLPRGDVDTLAVASQAEIEVDVSRPASHGFASLLRAGVEHILTGADHLAFLLALVLGGTLGAGESGKSLLTRARPLVAMLTAFTVGHSLSLGIATLAGIAPGTRVVEPAVALSVAYVGAENLRARGVGRGMGHAWLLTFPFGLVHGFAFAGGLLPLGVPRADLPVALLAFNLGVEAGQLAVLGALLPPLALLRRRAWYPKAARAVSAVIVVAGVAWFFERIA